MFKVQMKVIQPISKDLGEFVVRRSLPSSVRSVGPFVFFDHMGPAHVAMAVRPHPHIGLATVTYLFSGEITHRDNQGNHQNIRPGAINWMTAGRGICHSERSEKNELHGLQLWVALPEESETTDPKFTHYAADIIPEFENDQAHVKLLVGSALGHQSPVQVHSEMLFIDVTLASEREFVLDQNNKFEYALYVIEGEILLPEKIGPHELVIFSAGEPFRIQCGTNQAARFVIIGGPPLSQPRTIFWNFVATNKELIEAAKKSWKSGQFKLPEGETEFIPLPES